MLEEHQVHTVEEQGCDRSVSAVHPQSQHSNVAME